MAFILVLTTTLFNNLISAQGLNIMPALLKLTQQQQQQQHQQQEQQRHQLNFQQQQIANNNRPQINNNYPNMTRESNSFTLHKHNPRKNSGESSSSFFADIEDLNDSSIKSRVGQLGAEPIEQPLLDFDTLIERLTKQISELAHQKHMSVFQSKAYSQPKQQHNQAQHQHPIPVLKIPADPNNKTTMRFFRNSKTFASIVYTDDHKQQELGFTGIRHARKLINCHLVDLEKHSSDVALFEAKYEIETVDIEFRDMMSIIEACTDIARFKPLKGLNPSNSAGGAQQSSSSSSSSLKNQNSAMKPLIIVGQHVPVQNQQTITTTTMSNMPPPQNLASNSVTTFRNVMSESIGKELNSLPNISASGGNGLTEELAGNLRAKRKFVGNGGVSSRQLGRQANNNLLQQRPQQHQQRQQQQLKLQARPVSQARAAGGAGLISTALARVGETSKKLVLGEVTPPPNVVDGRTGGIKEALQEITQYDTTDLMAIWRGILPGTNWCGMGDRATSYNDLGFESDIDICCRAHDFCPIRLSAFSAGYGLFNWSFYTRSHCRCDQNFLDCLQRAESPLSQVVLKFYFNIMKTTCLHDNETSQFQPQAQSQSRFWTPGGNSGISSPSQSSSSSSNSMSKQQQQLQRAVQHQQRPQQQQQQQPAQKLLTQLLAPSNDQQRLLLDQIRASFPIPAHKHSTSVGSATEDK